MTQLISRSFCCSSLQNRNQFIGLRFCFSNGKGHFVVRNCDRFAWIRAGKIPQEAFSAWSKEAQKEKVKCENGEINQKIFAMAEESFITPTAVTSFDTDAMRMMWLGCIATPSSALPNPRA